jgi:type IV pilus assembly protein PilM
MLKKGKGPTAVGLDIGSYSVKCVEIDPQRGVAQLLRVSILPVRPGSPESVTNALKVLLGQSSFQDKRVRISVSGGSSLLIRRIQLPSMTASELKGAIRFEAESHIPFPIGECQLDFQILGFTEDRKMMNVMLVAAKKELLQDRLKLLSAVNIVPVLIDVDIFCLINAYEVLGKTGENTTFGLLNIGHRMSSFAIVRDKQPFFVREIPMGAYGVTKALAGAKGISEEEADHMKIGPNAGADADVRGAVEKGLDPLIEEMRHSIDYVENDTGEDLKTIWLSGGGALSPGSAQLLSTELGRQVSLWDNTKRLEVFGDIDHEYLTAHSLELNVALGMVLRGTGAGK